MAAIVNQNTRRSRCSVECVAAGAPRCHFQIHRLTLILDGALKVIKQIQLLIGLFMLTGELQVEDLALTIIDDLIGGFNLIQKGLDLGERFASGHVLWIGVYNLSGSGKFVFKFASKKRVILGRLGNNFAIRLSSVQGSEPPFKRQAASKSHLIQPRHGLSKRHIEMCHDREILFRAGYLKQQKTS